jgi:hypothetical protein
MKFSLLLFIPANISGLSCFMLSAPCRFQGVASFSPFQRQK